MQNGFRPLRFGEALPLLFAAANRNPRFALGSLGGRYMLFCVIGNARAAEAKAALNAVKGVRHDASVRACAVFGADPNWTKAFAAFGEDTLVFNDPDIARASGLHDTRMPAGRWVLLDPNLRVLGLWPLTQTKAALAALARLPGDDASPRTHAPVLIAPRIFEPEFCQSLIAYYDRHGGEQSGVTRERPGGTTYVTLNEDFKRRMDRLIADPQLCETAMHRIYWRLIPEIEKAFMWRATRMERYLVARYDAQSGGFFKPHRDNTTKGTAHRRFAVTINLNAGDYEGGDLRFPEFGAQTYRAPTGGAVVFSCSLLHEATPVTRGTRYAFLPFLYDESAAKLRADNEKYLDESLRAPSDTSAG